MKRKLKKFPSTSQRRAGAAMQHNQNLNNIESMLQQVLKEKVDVEKHQILQNHI
jgi:hypothetical protein